MRWGPLAIAFIYFTNSILFTWLMVLGCIWLFDHRGIWWLVTGVFLFPYTLFIFPVEIAIKYNDFQFLVPSIALAVINIIIQYVNNLKSS